MRQTAQEVQEEREKKREIDFKDFKQIQRAQKLKKRNLNIEIASEILDLIIDVADEAFNQLETTKTSLETTSQA